MNLKSLISRSARVSLGALGAAALLATVPTPARAEPAMWVVKDADSMIYLLGTVHLMRKEVVWKTPQVDKAIADAGELWLEIAEVDDPGAMAPLVQKYGVDTAKPLSAKLTEAQRVKLAEVAGRYGVPVAGLEPLKPWMAGLMLTVLPLQKAGFDPNAGVDKLIKAEAVAQGDQVKAFETVEQQLQFFDGLSEAEQVSFLMSVVDDAEEGVATLDAMASAWAKGDMAPIERELVTEMKVQYPRLYDVILTRRNKAWAEQIQTMLKGSGVHLIAVGAGHLAGPDSVQAQLKARGIEAERR